MPAPSSTRIFSLVEAFLKDTACKAGALRRRWAVQQLSGYWGLHLLQHVQYRFVYIILCTCTMRAHAPRLFF